MDMRNRSKRIKSIYSSAEKRSMAIARTEIITNESNLAVLESFRDFPNINIIIKDSLFRMFIIGRIFKNLQQEVIQ